jgi:hypothetical protein
LGDIFFACHQSESKQWKLKKPDLNFLQNSLVVFTREVIVTGTEAVPAELKLLPSKINLFCTIGIK